jgi:hypothetical protein
MEEGDNSSSNSNRGRNSRPRRAASKDSREETSDTPHVKHMDVKDKEVYDVTSSEDDHEMMNEEPKGRGHC